MAERAARPMLKIEDLHVYYGESHAIQGVSLTLERGVLSVVGRNGMGKTTLCNTITGLKRARSGSIRVDGREVSTLEPHEIHNLGVGYVPQGRRVWPSLTVDEHLQAGGRHQARRQPGPSSASTRPFRGWPSGATMAARSCPAASSRCWRSRGRCSSDPKLLVMDEPTEGLAPVIVEPGRAHAGHARRRRRDGDPGHRAEHRRRHRRLRPRRDHGQWPHQPHHGSARAGRRPRAAAAAAGRRPPWRRGAGAGRRRGRQCRAARRRRLSHRARRRRGQRRSSRRAASIARSPNCRTAGTCRSPRCAQAAVERTTPADDAKKVFAIPFAERIGRTVLVAGTFDTKGKELRFIADRLKALRYPGEDRRPVDLGQAVERRRAGHAGGGHASRAAPRR